VEHLNGVASSQWCSVVAPRHGEYHHAQPQQGQEQYESQVVHTLLAPVLKARAALESPAQLGQVDVSHEALEQALRVLAWVP
jgi:hypothetical protein